jgi:hypothetical protein
MTAIARALSRALPATQTNVEALKTITVFCGVGLLVSLLLATAGIDITAGYF